MRFATPLPLGSGTEVPCNVSGMNVLVERLELCLQVFACVASGSLPLRCNAMMVTLLGVCQDSFENVVSGEAAKAWDGPLLVAVESNGPAGPELMPLPPLALVDGKATVPQVCFVMCSFAAIRDVELFAVVGAADCRCGRGPSSQWSLRAGLLAEPTAPGAGSASL